MQALDHHLLCQCPHCIRADHRRRLARKKPELCKTCFNLRTVYVAQGDGCRFKRTPCPSCRK